MGSRLKLRLQIPFKRQNVLILGNTTINYEVASSITRRSFTFPIDSKPKATKLATRFVSSQNIFFGGSVWIAVQTLSVFFPRVNTYAPIFQCDVKTAPNIFWENAQQVWKTFIGFANQTAHDARLLRSTSSLGSCNPFETTYALQASLHQRGPKRNDKLQQQICAMLAQDNIMRKTNNKYSGRQRAGEVDNIGAGDRNRI